MAFSRQQSPQQSSHTHSSSVLGQSGWGRNLILTAVTGVTTLAGLGVSGAIAGEYFTEETTSAAVDIVHGWNHTEGNYSISITNSGRSRLVVPLDVNGAQACSLTAFGLNDGTTLSVGSLDDSCNLPLFPYLDRLINQQVQTLLITLDNQLVEIPLTDDDRLALARVADQSRDAYLLFQEEVAKAVAFYSEGQSQPASAPPTASNPAPPPASSESSTEFAPAAPTPVETLPDEAPAASNPPPAGPEPAPATPAPAPVAAAPGEGQAELVIVGNIEESAVPGGSRLTVQAVNTSNLAVRAAQARFEFTFNNEVVDTRTVAFTPNTIPPGMTATAEVTKTEQNWDSVSVSFLWDRPVP